ncbi:MAG TPA: hypothetical protein P5033_10545, partial [Anaerohalosphaeraceae bacterium]|nr:hypothetical protein [Anaerohalosphaeraceae bacterium]
MKLLYVKCEAVESIEGLYPQFAIWNGQPLYVCRKDGLSKIYFDGVWKISHGSMIWTGNAITPIGIYTPDTD